METDWQELTPGPKMDILKTGLRMADIIVRVTEALKGKPVADKQQGYAEVFFAKFYRHFLSSLYLFQLTQLPQLNVQFYDYGSLFVLARASLETFLAFDYLYVQPQTDEERCFRFDAWWRAGLLQRQSYAPHHPNDLAKQAREKTEVEALTNRLTETDIFRNMTDQKRFRRGEWRFLSWPQIARAAGFNDLYSRQIYAFLSGYAHTDMQSLLQLRQMMLEKDDDALWVMRKTSFGLMFVVAAHFIDRYSRILPASLGALTAADAKFLDPWRRMAA